LFVLGTFFMAYIAMPLYFVLYVWRDTEGAPIPDAQVGWGPPT
jgi:hypothetical protein